LCALIFTLGSITAVAVAMESSYANCRVTASHNEIRNRERNKIDFVSCQSAA
jgi:hypothetical protein